jgi:hypothetical protein
VFEEMMKGQTEFQIFVGIFAFIAWRETVAMVPSQGSHIYLLAMHILPVAKVTIFLTLEKSTIDRKLC